MKEIFYDTKGGGYKFHYGDWPIYIGYSFKEAVTQFRWDNGLRKKHIKFTNIDEQPSLSELLKKPGAVKALNDLVNGTR